MMNPTHIASTARMTGPSVHASISNCRDWDDSKLLSEMLERNEGAWKEFHRRYIRLVYRCVQKVVRRFPSRVHAEDIHEIQASFFLSLNARDMHKLRSFDASRGNKLSSWIGMLATNCAWDYMRRMARRPQAAPMHDAAEIRVEMPDAFDHVLRKERIRKINQTLSGFSEKDRLFMDLFYMQGLRPEEIAVRMSISVKTVYSKKHKIRARLERALKHAA